MGKYLCLKVNQINNIKAIMVCRVKVCMTIAYFDIPMIVLL